MQKIADQVRVNVQLVNAQTDSPLWADTLPELDLHLRSRERDRQTNSALVAGEANGREEQVLALKPTNNPGGLR